MASTTEANAAAGTSLGSAPPFASAAAAHVSSGTPKAPHGAVTFAASPAASTAVSQLVEALAPSCPATFPRARRRDWTGTSPTRRAPAPASRGTRDRRPGRGAASPRQPAPRTSRLRCRSTPGEKNRRERAPCGANLPRRRARARARRRRSRKTRARRRREPRGASENPRTVEPNRRTRRTRPISHTEPFSFSARCRRRLLFFLFRCRRRLLRCIVIFSGVVVVVSGVVVVGVVVVSGVVVVVSARATRRSASRIARASASSAGGGNGTVSLAARAYARARDSPRLGLSSRG